MKFVIPARKGSKGLPGKNRILLQHTIKNIPEEFSSDVIITTDDEVIINKLSDSKFNILARKAELGGDEISIRDVLQEVIQHYNIESGEDIIMLYLTYPQRSWQDILDAIAFYQNNNAKSLLCRKEIKTHPFLCLIEEEEYRGSQVRNHDLYRRQDYPKCFEISHYICIFEASEIKFLNKNMYNNNTRFYPIDDCIDVDTEGDLKKYHDTSHS